MFFEREHFIWLNVNFQSQISNLKPQTFNHYYLFSIRCSPCPVLAV